MRGSVVVVVIFCLVLFLLLSFWNAEKNGKYNNSFESQISLMYTHNRLLSSVESVIRGGGGGESTVCSSSCLEVGNVDFGLNSILIFFPQRHR